MGVDCDEFDIFIDEDGGELSVSIATDENGSSLWFEGAGMAWPTKKAVKNLIKALENHLQYFDRRYK